MPAERREPPPDLRLEDLPPPGNARRRLLRQHGMGIRRSDFSDEELAQRGIAVDDPDAGPGAAGQSPTR